ncbi:MAG: hypothetical protein IID44_00420 [Planctomycetes bacterium]|nr:hypothetical protein [Planctomycetota bacterium]
MMRRQNRIRRWPGVSAAESAVLLAALLLGPLLLGPTVARAEETLAERKTRIAAMSPAEKEELRRKKERFDKFDEEKQQRLRKVQKRIASDPKSQRLMAVMEHYRTWLTTLTALERDELRGLQGPQRVKRIKELMEQQFDQETKERIEKATRGVAFSREERERVYKWLAAYFKTHQQELLDDLPVETRRKMLQYKNSPYFHMMLFPLWKRSVGPEKRLPLADQDIEQFKKLLPPKAQKLFDEERDPLAKRELVHRLVVASLPRFGGRPPHGRHDPRRYGRLPWGSRPSISQDKLDAFFENGLNDEERREVTRHQGKEAINRELMRLYVKKKSRSRRGGGRRGPGPPGDRRPDQRGPPNDGPPGRRGPDEGRF